MTLPIPHSSTRKIEEVYRFQTTRDVKDLLDRYASEPDCFIELKSEYHVDESPDGESVNWSYVWVAKITYKDNGED